MQACSARALSRANPLARTVSTTPRSSSYDAIVLGGGHNGLVAAAYLAKAGKRVIVLERRHLLGGAAVTEELVPGFKFSRASYLYSLFRPRIVEDLNLAAHGLVLLPRRPNSFTPVPGPGPSLLLGSSPQEDEASIAQFSKEDAAAYAEYNAVMGRFSDVFTPLLDRPPPDPGLLGSVGSRDWLSNAADSFAAARSIASLGRDIPGLWELLTAPASKILDRWFKSDILKVTLGTDAIIGAFVAPSTAGSAYVLLHHVMCGVWAQVRGGMGALSEAIASSARASGAELLVNAPVARILTEEVPSKSPDGATHRVRGVELENGIILRAPVVLSTVAPTTTFRTLLEVKGGAASPLPASFQAAVTSLSVRSGSVKINLALNALPSFTCRPNTGGAAMPHHRGTTHFETIPEQVEEAHREALAGVPSSRPVIEMTLPSVLDPSLAPPGCHVCLLFVQYAPYDVTAWKGPLGWDTPGAREEFAARVFAVIEEYAPGFTASIVGKPDILTPVDLERVFGLPGGNIFQLAMPLDQLLFARPVPGWARYRTPVQGLLLAGAGAHPGGGVMGAPGRNAALVALQDMR